MTTPATYYLFVYGSLRSGFHHPAYEYISRYFNFVSDGKVKGLLYDMGEYPGALPTNEEAYIIGELYHIKHSDEFEWALAQLDDYEGLNTEPGEPQLFRRELVTVYTVTETHEAWIYWFNGDVSNQPLVKSGDVLEYRRQKEQH